MEKEEFMHLQHSESVVAQMAATIFSSLIARDTSYASNEDELIEKSVALAIKLAKRADKMVKSDQEWVKKDTDSAFLSG